MFLAGSAAVPRSSRRWAVVVLAVAWLMTTAPAGAQGGKISVSPSAPVVSEGGSIVIDLGLSNPILGPGPDPAVVVLTLVSDDPSRVTLPSPTLTWTASEWFQPRSLSVVVNADGVFNDSDLVTLEEVVESASEFYDGFVVRVPVTITDLDPEPTTTAAPATNDPSSEPTESIAPTLTVSTAPAAGDASANAPDELALTGTSSGWVAALGGALVICGAGLLRRGRARA